MSSWKFKKWANTRITIARELCCLKARGILIDFKVPKTRLGFYVSCNRHRVYFINVYIYIYYYYNRLKITILFYYQVLGDNPFLSKRCLCISSLHTSTWLLHESTVMNHLLCCRQNKNTVMFLIYGIIPSRRNYYEIVVFWLYLKVIFRQWIYNKMPCKISYTESRMILLHWHCVQWGVVGVSTGQASSIK